MKYNVTCVLFHSETKPAPVPTVVDEHAGIPYKALGEDNSIPRDGTLIA